MYFCYYARLLCFSIIIDSTYTWVAAVQMPDNHERYAVPINKHEQRDVIRVLQEARNKLVHLKAHPCERKCNALTWEPVESDEQLQARIDAIDEEIKLICNSIAQRLQH